ncbi:hypothetical protein [Yinghuangia sp. YIM S09857]|uniref:hypothetical protein n=1 Tax=Yinghuangia sp. YIM S09857 TaxID=3436929 RepID=UPI003F52BE81
MAASRDDTTLDIVIAFLRGGVATVLLGSFALLAEAGPTRRAVVAVAVAAGPVAAVHYLVRRGHRPGVARPPGRDG